MPIHIHAQRCGHTSKTHANTHRDYWNLNLSLDNTLTTELFTWLNIKVRSHFERFS